MNLLKFWWCQELDKLEEKADVDCGKMLVSLEMVKYMI
jgi:hypothetical protein